MVKKERKYYTAEEIFSMLDVDTCFDDEELRHKVASALSKIPKKIVDKVINECKFLRPFVGGMFINKELISGKNLIVISDSFFQNSNSEEIEKALLHEIAHFVLKHKISAVKEEYERQEEEAEKLVEKWLEDWKNQKY